MKIRFWDILASLVMLAGLGLAVIFINIFVNPHTFLNPFPPPTATPTFDPNTPTAPSLPELWTVTPETPGVPSVTSIYSNEQLTAIASQYVLPTRTINPYAFATYTRTPNYALTAYFSFRTPTRTITPSGDTTPPTDPGIPNTSSPTTDSTPTWFWNGSTDSGTGLNYYQLTWGGDIDCNNTVYVTSNNSWTAPAITSNSIYYICVRARDRAGNYSNWVGPSGFFYSGPVGPATATFTATRTPTRTSTSTATLVPTSTFTGMPTSTVTSTATHTLIPPTATDTLIPPTLTFTLVPPTATDTLPPPPTMTDTLVPPPTMTDTLVPPPTMTDTLAPPPTMTDTLVPPPTMTDTLVPAPPPVDTDTPVPTVTDTLVPVPTVTDTLVPGPTSFTISGNTGVGPTATPSGEPVAGVYITTTGDPGAVVTQPDGYGNYSVVVPANWSGKISPSRYGYQFTPVSYDYANVNADITGQNFTSAEAAFSFTISGNVGAIPGATVLADNGAVVITQPVMDGNYQVAVYGGWSGSISVTQPGCTYAPPQINFPPVGGDLTDQNFTPACP